MVDAATHSAQAGELATTGTDIAVMLVQQSTGGPDTTDLSGAQGYSDLTPVIVLAHGLRWAVANSTAAMVLLLLFFAAAIYGAAAILGELGGR